MNKRLPLCFLLCFCFLFSACGSSPPDNKEGSDSFNRAVSCHYHKHFQFDNISSRAWYSAPHIYGLEEDYLGYIIDEEYNTLGCYDRVNNNGNYEKEIIVYTYRKDGEKFELRFSKDFPKYIAATSHKPVKLGTGSAVIYKYGAETFARYVSGEYTFELSCTDVSDEFFLELLTAVCPTGATAPQGQAYGQARISDLQAYYTYSPSYTTDSSRDTGEICAEADIPQNTKNFTAISSKAQNYDDKITVPDYVVTFTHKKGGSAEIKTSSSPEKLPQWWQIGSNDEWSLFRIGNGYAIIFGDETDFIARCFDGKRYYEITAEGISSDALNELISAVCS